jgi:hypothetical protein
LVTSTVEIYQGEITLVGRDEKNLVWAIKELEKIINNF